MSYSNLYQEVLIKLDPVHPQNNSRRNVSSARPRSRSDLSPRSEREIRKSRSAGEGLATAHHSPDKKYETLEDLRYLLIPAIMKVEKERLSRLPDGEKKIITDSEMSSSMLCGLSWDSLNDTTWKLIKSADQESSSEQDLNESSGNSSPNTQPSDSETFIIQSRRSGSHEGNQLSCSDHCDDSSHSSDSDVNSDQLSNSISNDSPSQSSYTRYETDDSDQTNCSKFDECTQSVSIKDDQQSQCSKSKSSSSRYVQSSESKTRKHVSSGYNSSSLQTSEIPASPDNASRRLEDVASDTPTGGRGLTQNVRLLEMAERAVQSLLEEVLAVEARQEAERRNIADETERLEAKQRDARANEAYVRTVLAGRGVRMGTLEAAYLYQLWEAMKTERRDNRRGITFDVWLKEKREKFREEKEQLVKEQREKEEVQKAKKERARVAFEKWCDVAKKRPKPQPFMILATGKDSKKFIRPGTFYNPNPWVDVLEEEQKNKALSEATPKSEETDGPQLCHSLSTIRSEARQSAVQHLTMSFEKTLPKARVKTLGRSSTYDKLVDFYTDLLKRCTAQRHHHVPRPVKNDGISVALHRPTSKSKTNTTESGSVRSKHETVSNSNPFLRCSLTECIDPNGQVCDIKR